MNQRPGLYIMDCPDKGRGVFCSEPIFKGDLIEICPVIIIAQNELPVIHKTRLHDYYFLWKKEGAIALGFGSLYNHAEKPNATFIPDHQNMTIDFYAIRDIIAGEEITIDYHEGDTIGRSLWF